MTTVDRSRVSWMLPKPGTSERSTHTGRAGSPAVSASTARWLVAVSWCLDIANWLARRGKKPWRVKEGLLAPYRPVPARCAHRRRPSSRGHTATPERHRVPCLRSFEWSAEKVDFIHAVWCAGGDMRHGPVCCSLGSGLIVAVFRWEFIFSLDIVRVRL